MPLCRKIVESCETDAVVGSLNQMHMNRCRLSCACEKLYADVNQRAVTTAAFGHVISNEWLRAFGSSKTISKTIMAH